MDEWKKLDFQPDGIYTGFLADAAQADKVLSFIALFGGENVKILVDPVMGDDGEEYPIYTEELCEKMRFLAKKAAVITPNLTEALLLLYGRERAHEVWTELCDFEENDLVRFVEETGYKLARAYETEVVITGIDLPIKDGVQEMGNLICSRDCPVDKSTEAWRKLFRNGRSVCVGVKCRAGERNGYGGVCPKSSKFSCKRDTRCG